MSQPKTQSRLRGRSWVAIEIALVLVIAFMVGRLTATKSTAATPGTVDVGFSQDMAVHHEQALLMASLAQTHGDREVQGIANGILLAQSQEVGLLRGWLTLWRKPAADPTPMSWLPGHEMAAGVAHTMPGMASTTQLAALSSEDGSRFNILFLQLMIRHHEGGVEMAQYAQAHAKLAVVRSAARAMAAAQIEELGEMRALLTALGGKPLPPP